MVTQFKCDKYLLTFTSNNKTNRIPLFNTPWQLIVTIILDWVAQKKVSFISNSPFRKKKIVTRWHRYARQLVSVTYTFYYEHEQNCATFRFGTLVSHPFVCTLKFMSAPWGSRSQCVATGQLRSAKSTTTTCRKRRTKCQRRECRVWYTCSTRTDLLI